MGIEDARCTLHLQWAPSHIRTIGNEADDNLAKAAYQYEEPTVRFHCIVEGSRLIIQCIERLRHPDARVAASIPPPSVPDQDVSRAVRALLHHFRYDSAFTGVTLQGVGRQASSSSLTCLTP